MRKSILASSLLLSLVCFSAFTDESSSADNAAIEESLVATDESPSTDNAATDESVVVTDKSPAVTNGSLVATDEPPSTDNATLDRSPAATEDCGLSPRRPLRVSLRHIEGHGIGYNTGYTSLDLFLSPNTTCYLPFLDLRGHLFDDGKWAANGGIGLRYLAAQRTYGINAYYDYRAASRHHYNQVSVGLESLGTRWDFRINGYLPFGSKASHWYHSKFEGFEGHSMIIRRKQEFSMKGLDGEVGAHLNQLERPWDFYAALGPYYFEGKGKNAYGGKARLAIRYRDYISLEGSASYDNVFHDIYQGQIGLSWPFGRKARLRRKGSNSCSDLRILRRRMVEPVARQEIIVVDKRHKNFAATNPATGDPFFFIFVNNTGSSDGSFEHPFPTLAQAQNASGPNDVIYVFPGNGSAYGGSITLKPGQKLWGSGTSYTLQTSQGTIPVPAQTSTMPLLTNTAFFQPVVVLANSCEVAGLHITGTQGGDGILGGDPTFENPMVLGITDTFIHDNVISDIFATNGGIALQNCQGNLIIANNQISNTNAFGISVENRNVPVSATLTIKDNNVSSDPTFSAIGIDHSPPSGHLNATIKRNNTSQGFQGIGFGSTFSSAATICGTITDNISHNNSQYGVLIIADPSQNIQVEVTNNTLTGNTEGGFLAIAEVGTICLQLQNNISENNGGPGYTLTQSGSGILDVENLANVQNNNTGTFSMTGTVNDVPSGTCDCQ